MALRSIFRENAATGNLRRIQTGVERLDRAAGKIDDRVRIAATGLCASQMVGKRGMGRGVVDGDGIVSHQLLDAQAGDFAASAPTMRKPPSELPDLTQARGTAHTARRMADSRAGVENAPVSPRHLLGVDHVASRRRTTSGVCGPEVFMKAPTGGVVVIAQRVTMAVIKIRKKQPLLSRLLQCRTLVGLRSTPVTTTYVPKQTATNGRVVQIDSIELYYEEYGSGEPLVLLHGFDGSGRNWDPFVARLQNPID